MFLVVDVKRRQAVDLHVFLMPIYVILTHRKRQVVVVAEHTNGANDREVAVLVTFSDTYDAIRIPIGRRSTALGFLLLLLLDERVGLHGYGNPHAPSRIRFKTDFESTGK
jgi:hypothetical protein